MDPVRPLDPFSFRAPVWLIQVEHPDLGQTSFLQAEGPRGTYLLVFTTASKAREAMAALGMPRAASTCVSLNLEVRLAVALCQVGARGVLVDFDPASQRAAWSRELVANA
jgi:hypothetical protein